MDKVLEALKIVDNILNNFGGDKVQIETMTLSKCNILKIKQALFEIQALKEAESSEALKYLEELGTNRIEYNESFEFGLTKTMPFKSTMEYKIIHQALLKAQENSKLLGYLKNSLSLIPMENGEDEIGIGCPINGDTIGPNDEGYEVIKKWLSNGVLE